MNSKGEFNVPFGKYRHPAILQEAKLHLAAKLLKDTELKITDFGQVIIDAQEKDFIYFDPPYFPLSKTSSFTGYQKTDFIENEQRRLAKVFHELDKKGCLVMLSNSDAPFIRDLYGKTGFNMHVVKARRSINCIGTKRGKINELVITNY